MRTFGRRELLGAAGAALALAAGARARRAFGAEQVDLALVLAADVSRSINDDEFQLQRNGYATAITSAAVLNAISLGERRAIALCYNEWAGEGEEKVLLDWAVIRDKDSARAFADKLLAQPRAYLGRTAIGSAIEFSMNLIAESGFDAPRHVIDVSGDGTSNQGDTVTVARDAAVAAGATINGLAIFNKRAAAQGGYLAAHTNPPGGIAKYYRDNVIGGPGAFVEQIDDFNSFGEAMIRKLVSEIARIEPAQGGATAG
jgi:hypothetical protein